MASIFDKISEVIQTSKISNTIQSAGQEGLTKAKELKDTAKLTIDIKEREGSIQKLYRELGKAYYNDHKNDAAPDYSQIDAINAAVEEIKQLKALIDEIKGLKKCPDCGAPVALNAKFCKDCGAKLQADEEVFTGDVVDDAEEIVEEVVEEAEEAVEEVAEEAAEEPVAEEKTEE